MLVLNVIVMAVVVGIIARVVVYNSEKAFKIMCEDRNIPYNDEPESMKELITTGREIWDGKNCPR